MLSNVLADLRRELTWFYNSSHASLGLRSNFGAVLAGVTRTDHEPSDADLDAVGRERRIRSVMSQLPVEHRRVLEAYFTVENDHPQLRALYGEYLRVVRLWRSRDELLFLRAKEAEALLTRAKAAVRDAERSLVSVMKEVSI